MKIHYFIKWLKFINAESLEEMRKIAKGDEIMEQALKFMEDFLNDEEIRNVYDKINDVERYAKRRGMAEGLAEGRKENAIETAKRLLSTNLTISEIATATGLSIKEVEALK